MLKLVRITLLLLSFINYHQLLAKDSNNEQYTIHQLLYLAEKNSANIKAIDLQTIAQKHYANQQKYWQNPVVNLSQSSNSNSYSVSQNIPFYQKLDNKYKIEEIQANILENQSMT